MNTYFENLRTKENPTIGQIKAYRVYKNNFILEDFLWEKEVKDFVNTLREGGVKYFVYTSTSTALMSNFHAFIENGCKFVETCNVEFSIFEESKKGLRFEVL
jgi:hypothetical protein